MAWLKSQRVQRLLSARALLFGVTLGVLLVQTILFANSARIHGFATGDGGVKLWQVQSILRTGNLNAPLTYSGAVYDPDHLYAPFIEPWAFSSDGQFYTEYTSPFIWASVPLFALFGHAGLLILPWLSGMLLVIMTAWLAWHVRPDRSAALAPLIAGLSPVLVYSLEFWEHTPGAALAVFALLAIVQAFDSRRRAWWLIASGAAIGLGLTMRAELYVYPLAVIIGLWSIRSARQVPIVRSLGWLAVGGLIAAGPWWLYQFAVWGSPFGPRLQRNVPVLGGTEMLKRLGDTTGKNWSMVWPADGSQLLVVLTIVVLILALGAWLLRRRVRWAADAAFWAGSASLVIMAILLMAQLAHGQRPDDLLTTFPIVLLLLLPAPRTVDRAAAPDRQHTAIIRFLLIVSLAFVLLVVLASPFHGGIQWGPRFLLLVLPPLTVVVVERLGRLWSAMERPTRVGLAVVIAALLAVDAYSAWLGVKFMQEGQTASAFMSEVIRNSPEKVVVADAWFLPQNAPYLLDDKIWLLAEDQKKMFQLLQLLRKQTNEPGFIYTSALTWAHIDPQMVMGARIAPAADGQKVQVNAPTQYIEISRYQLLK